MKIKDSAFRKWFDSIVDKDFVWNGRNPLNPPYQGDFKSSNPLNPPYQGDFKSSNPLNPPYQGDFKSSIFRIGGALVFERNIFFGQPSAY